MKSCSGCGDPIANKARMCRYCLSVEGQQCGNCHYWKPDAAYEMDEFGFPMTGSMGRPCWHPDSIKKYGNEGTAFHSWDHCRDWEKIVEEDA